MSRVNVPLLEATLDQIETERKRKRWDQGVWRSLRTRYNARKKVYETISCGTAMCFAGWAATLDGARFVYDDKKVLADFNPQNGDGHGFSELEMIYARKPEVNAGITTKFDGKDVISVRERAKRALRLSEHDADILFSGDNSIVRLRRFVKELKEGKQLVDPDGD